MPRVPAKVLRVGDCEIDLAASRLTRAGVEVAVPRLAFRLIAVLASSPGVMFSRDALRDTLWPDVHVTDNSLDQVVRRARRALGPGALTTVSGRGLRLDLDVDPHVTPPPSGWIGRSAELAELAAATLASPLVTVQGPGGMGKTTLAQAWLASRAEVGAVFVTLEGSHTPEDVSAAVRAAVEPTAPDDATHATLAAAGDLTLVLDNAEGAVGPLSALLPRWLAAAPRLRVVVTSRAALGLRAERVLRLGPMTRDDATALFVDRAGALAADPAVPALVDYLDGLPLAIELAARRARWMAPGELLASLRAHESSLSDPSADRPERHRSLEAALATCWDALDGPQRRAVLGLTPLRGAFSPEHAHGLLGPGAVDHLQDLADRSWLQVGPKGALRMLTATRRFIRERAEPADLAAADAAHGRWFSRAPASDEPVDVARSALPDRMSAATAAIERGDAQVSAGAILAAWPALRRQGPLTVAVGLLEGALALDDGTRAPALRHALGIALT